MISDMMIVIYQLSRASLLTLWTTKLWRSIVDNDNYQSDDDVLRWLFLAAKQVFFDIYVMRDDKDGHQELLSALGFSCWSCGPQNS